MYIGPCDRCIGPCGVECIGTCDVCVGTCDVCGGFFANGLLKLFDNGTGQLETLRGSRLFVRIIVRGSIGASAIMCELYVEVGAAGFGLEDSFESNRVRGLGLYFNATRSCGNGTDAGKLVCRCNVAASLFDSTEYC